MNCLCSKDKKRLLRIGDLSSVMVWILIQVVEGWRNTARGGGGGEKKMSDTTIAFPIKG